MHPDLPKEQAYFDRALALRDRQQADLARAPRLAANPRAAVELRKRVSKLGLADPDEAIAFGRIDADHDRWYIGKGAIWDDDNELVVVNWQAPIAAPFYTATPDAPEGLDARRLFRCTGNQIREIEDLVFRDMAEAVSTGREPQPVLSDALLDALGSARSGELGSIVATIQAAQYAVISADIDQLLVVQGGPGTGKTVVGLHRVSWLLFNRRDRLEANDVLIVGPNPAFVHYISSVLPSLGDEAVVQLPLRALGPRVRVGRVDPPELRRLKGDRRMLRLVLRGLRNRQRVEAREVELGVGGRRVRLDGRRLATRARQLAGRPHNEGYRMLRAFVVAEARAALMRGGLHDPVALEAAVRGESAREIDNLLDRVWPSLTPQGFLVDLLSSRRQLLAAGAGTLAPAELAMLALPSDAQVSTWQWSVDDIPLLDAADALLNGVPATYEHIVVDEAQDLSPLQLESIRRRSRTGSMTVLGDLAQATSPWAHESWDAVIACLRHERVTATTVELEYGYRLPVEVHEVAMRLLPDVAPGLASPRAVRASGHEVAVAPAGSDDDLAPAAVAAVRGLLGSGIVGVISPPSVRTALVAELDAEGIVWSPELRPAAAPVVVLAPDDAKGLEFDVVVVVEPAAIVDESEHGLRALFVALTRCTSRLALVHARPLPPALGLGSGVVDARGEPAPAVAEPAHAHEEEAAVAEPEDAQPDPSRWIDITPAEPELEPWFHPAPQPEPGPHPAPEPAAVEAEPEPAVHPAPQPEPGVYPAPGPEPGVHAAPQPEPGVYSAPQPEPGVHPAADPVVAGPGPEPAVESDAPPESEQAAAPGLADRVVVSTPGPDVAAALDALGDLDHEIARAVARAVADKLGRVVTPALLPLVAAELVRALDELADPDPDAGANGHAAPADPVDDPDPAGAWTAPPSV
jgi:DNA helicase IV